MSCALRFGEKISEIFSENSSASFQIWLHWESREWIITNAADGITPAAIQSSIPKPPSKVSLNLHSNRIIVENTVLITVD